MDNQHQQNNASTEIEQPAATQEQQKPKKVRRKTRLEKLAEAEQKLAQAQAEVDRLRAEEEQLNTKMKIKMAAFVIEVLQGKTDDDSEDPALVSLMKMLEEQGSQKIPKDLLGWIKTIA